MKNIKKIICILLCMFFGGVATVSAGLFSKGKNHRRESVAMHCLSGQEVADFEEEVAEQAGDTFVVAVGNKNIEATLCEYGELIVPSCKFEELKSVFAAVISFGCAGRVKKIDLSSSFKEEELPKEIYSFINLETLILNKETRFPSIYNFKNLQLFEYRNKWGFPSFPKEKKLEVVNGDVFVQVRIYPIKMERVVAGGVDCVKVHTNRGFFIRIPLEGALDDIESIYVSRDTGVTLEFSRDLLVINVSEDNIVEELLLMYRPLGVFLKPPLFQRTRDVLC
jgi:hypothetical protein